MVTIGTSIYLHDFLSTKSSGCLCTHVFVTAKNAVYSNSLLKFNVGNNVYTFDYISKYVHLKMFWKFWNYTSKNSFLLSYNCVEVVSAY